MGRTAGRSGLERSVSATREKDLTIERNSHRRVDVGKILASSRVMMNAELVAGGQAKILVPTVFRPDYLGALRRLSRKGDPGPLVAAMARLWDFGRLLVGSDFESLRRRLEASNAFQDDDSAILRF